VFLSHILGNAKLGQLIGQLIRAYNIDEKNRRLRDVERSDVSRDAIATSSTIGLQQLINYYECDSCRQASIHYIIICHKRLSTICRRLASGVLNPDQAVTLKSEASSPREQFGDSNKHTEDFFTECSTIRYKRVYLLTEGCDDVYSRNPQSIVFSTLELGLESPQRSSLHVTVRYRGTGRSPRWLVVVGPRLSRVLDRCR
jgi:hypothetical protein